MNPRDIKWARMSSDETSPIYTDVLPKKHQGFFSEPIDKSLVADKIEAVIRDILSSGNTNPSISVSGTPSSKTPSAPTKSKPTFSATGLAPSPATTTATGSGDGDLRVEPLSTKSRIKEFEEFAKRKVLAIDKASHQITLRDLAVHNDILETDERYAGLDVLQSASKIFPKGLMRFADRKDIDGREPRMPIYEAMEQHKLNLDREYVESTWGRMDKARGQAIHHQQDMSRAKMNAPIRNEPKREPLFLVNDEAHSSTTLFPSSRT